MEKKRILFFFLIINLLAISINADLPEIIDLAASADDNNIVLNWSYSLYKFNCEENWQCSEWSSCIDNEQTRICSDLNNCGTFENKPQETQSCTSSYGDEEVCQDECSPDFNECVNPNEYKICSNYDEDECLEWSPAINCNQNEICENGECIIQQSCTDECSFGSQQCILNKYQKCEDLNNDGCSEWGQIINCNQDEICEEGICVSSYGNIFTAENVKEITGTSVKDPFKEALKDIINFFKKLFGLSERGAEISQISLEIYRNDVLINQGVLEDHCIQAENDYNCIYEDNELSPGDYSYYVRLSSDEESKTSNIADINICYPSCYEEEYPQIKFLSPINGSILNNNVSEIIVNTTLFNASVKAENLANSVEINLAKDENSNLFIGEIELAFGENIIEAESANGSSNFLDFIAVYRNEIQNSCLDKDGDGFNDASCGGNDCNDDARSVNINQTENCEDKRDNNCNNLIDLDDPQCLAVSNAPNPNINPQSRQKNNQQPKTEFQSKDAGDSDNDGLPDDWELAYFGNLKQNGNDDYDQDKITNLEEFKQETNPKISNLESNDSLIGLIIFIFLIAIITAPVVFIIKKIKNKKRMRLESQLANPQHKQIYEYIYKARKNKTPDYEIKNNLISAGWKSEEINYLFNIRS